MEDTFYRQKLAKIVEEIMGHPDGSQANKSIVPIDIP